MGKIVAIANPKGGVGKTSIILGLSAALNRLNKKVLLIDLDGAAALTFGLMGDKARNIEPSVYNILNHEIPIKDLLVEIEKGLYLIPSSLALDNLETDRVEGKLFLLRTALRGQESHFDYILIDTPPRLGVLSLNACIASQEIFAVVLADILSYRSLLSLRDTIEETAKRYTRGLKLGGIIINFYDNRRNIERFIREKILREYKEICFKNSIRRAVAIPESIMTGKNIFKYASWSPVANDFLRLAKEIIRRKV